MIEGDSEGDVLWRTPGPKMNPVHCVNVMKENMSPTNIVKGKG